MSLAITLGFLFPLQIWQWSVEHPQDHTASHGALLLLAISFLPMPDDSCLFWSASPCLVILCMSVKSGPCSDLPPHAWWFLHVCKKWAVFWSAPYAWWFLLVCKKWAVFWSALHAWWFLLVCKKWAVFWSAPYAWWFLLVLVCLSTTIHWRW